MSNRFLAVLSVPLAICLIHWKSGLGFSAGWILSTLSFFLIKRNVLKSGTSEKIGVPVLFGIFFRVLLVAVSVFAVLRLGGSLCWIPIGILYGLFIFVLFNQIK